MSLLKWGDVPVPYTVAWTAEERFYLDRCPYAGQLAIFQNVARGDGKPQFGKPHAQRQREVIAKDLCDLCGKPLAARTKISMSHARFRVNAAFGTRGILQVEPLLHKECAAECVKYCPSLKHDLLGGSLMLRHVTRHQVQFAIMDEEYVESITGVRAKAIGHAKVELLAWKDRSLEWLVGARGAAIICEAVQ